MNNIHKLLLNIWFRLGVVFHVAAILILVLVMGLNGLFFNQLRLDIRDAERGISRFEFEVENLEREVKVLEAKMTEKSAQSMDIYSHYYTFYKNPISYINQFVLTRSKPSGVIITSSSVRPNSGLQTKERELLKPNISKYGISRINNLGKIFSVVMVNMSINGDYSSVGQYIYNLYNLPVKFSLQNFEMRQSPNGVSLSLQLSFIRYRMNDDHI